MSKHCESANDLEVLVVVWVDAEAGHKAVDHQVHVSTLAPSAPGERLCGVEQESLRVHTHTLLSSAHSERGFDGKTSNTDTLTLRSITIDCTRRKMTEWSSQLMYVQAFDSLTQAMAALSVNCLLLLWPARAFLRLSKNNFCMETAHSNKSESIWNYFYFWKSGIRK